MPLHFTFLGTGTSQGIPVIGCECATCLSTDPRDNRMRCSALIKGQKGTVVIDVGPDFRQQMLTNKVTSIDAVFLTHEHNDHVIGLDDLRPLIFKNRRKMRIYAEKRVLDDIRLRFDYAFQVQQYPGAPSFDLIELFPGDEVKVGDITVQALRVYHGELPILGFRINDLAYLTDTNEIPTETYDLLGQLDFLAMDALRDRDHHSHNTLDQALGFCDKIKARVSYLLHMSHLLGRTKDWEKRLPDNVKPSYDGLTLDLN